MAEEEKILSAFAELKHQNSSYELKRINGRYYVYLSFGRRDNALGRIRKVSLYKGKITEEGVFVPLKHRRNGNRTEETMRYAQTAQQAENSKSISRFVDSRVRASSLKYEKTLLTALSMNGRISLPALSKMVGLSVNATDWQIRNLERRYGIRYMAEIDVTKFGYQQFLVTVKFLGDAPTSEELKAAVEKEPGVQLTMTTKGDFDVVLYVLAKNNEEASDMVATLRESIPSYESRWGTIPIYGYYGYIPVRDEFIEMLKERGALLGREYAVLKELNRNGEMDFAEIDKKYGFDTGRSQYSYHKLKSEGKIKRITISLQKLPIKYTCILFKEIINQEMFGRNRAKSLADIVEDSEAAVNKYIAQYDTANPDGSVLFMPVFSYDGLDEEVNKISGLGLGVRLVTLVIMNVLCGCFCYRKFDNAHSAQQKILEDEYKMPKAERINYEETGRKKKETHYNGDIRGSRFAVEPVTEIS